MKVKSFPKSDPYDVILVPVEALSNVNHHKRKNGKLIERLAGIKIAFDTFSKNPSRYAIMVISSSIADPLSFDILRQAKEINPRIKVMIASGAQDGGYENLENLPFVDNIVQYSIDSIDLAQIFALLGSNDEKMVLLAELESLGAEIDKFQQCTVHQLRGIVTGLKDLILRNSTTSEKPSLSELDKKILKDLILSKGRISSLTMSKNLDIPLTTLQRKRKKLESEFLEARYTLKYEKFGLRRAVLFISTLRGHNKDVGTKLLGFKEVLAVHKSIGAHNIDLHAEVIIRDNHELLNLIEGVKAIDGAREVMWSETLEIIGSNPDTTIRILVEDDRKS